MSYSMQFPRAEPGKEDKNYIHGGIWLPEGRRENM